MKNNISLLVLWQVFSVLLGLYAVTAVSGEHSSTLALTDNQFTLSAAPFMEILEDPSRQLKLGQVTNPEFNSHFIANTQVTPSFGRTRSAYWVRFTLINQSALKWYLLSDSFLEDEYEMYLLDGKAEVTANYAHKLASYRRPAWSLDMPVNKPLQVYIRATNGDSVFNLPVELVSADTMLERSNQDYRLYSSAYAAMLMIAAYNLFLFFALRESSYLILVIHTLSMVVVMHVYNPVFGGVDFLRNTGSHFFSAPYYIVFITLILFVRQLLQTHTHLPGFDRALTATAGLSVVLLPITGWIPAGTVLTGLASLVTFLLVFATSMVAARHGDRIAKYFFNIFLVYIIFILPNIVTLTFRGTSWNLHSYYSDAMPVGHVILILLLSVVQAERVRMLREQMQNTQAANLAKSKFLAMMSHELRTPINAIRGLSSLLCLTPLDKRQQEYVSRLELSSNHMAHLIGNVLDMAKIENHSLQLDCKPFQLNIVTQQIANLLAEDAAQKGLTLAFKGCEDVTETLLGDQGRLSQILINLLHNAIKFTPQGTVTFSVHKQGDTANGLLTLHFSVQDSGIGIPADKLAQVFDVFSQVNITPHSPSEGVGLGLAISHSLVAQMGGKLEAESTIGKGSQFFFTLAFMQAIDSQSATTEPLDNCLPQGIRILLVDDDEINRFVGQRLLQNFGGVVIVAANGRSTLRQLQQHSFDVVLLDISMPDMNGIEVLKWIRLHAPNRHVPVIALTAHATQAVEQQCQDAGANDFLSKPFDFQDLCVVIRRVLQV